MYMYLKIQEDTVFLEDRMAPREYPEGMAGWRLSEPMVFPFRSNARDSLDQDANLYTIHESCPHQDHAGSTCDPLGLCFRQKPTKMVAKMKEPGS